MINCEEDLWIMSIIFSGTPRRHFFLNKVSNIRCYTLTVAPSLIDMGFDFFPIWLPMLKPILETLRGADGSAEGSSSSSGVRCWDVRLTAVPSPPTVLQETGLVFTLPSSSCGPAWGKTTHQGEQQFPGNWRIIKAIIFTCVANVTIRF